MRQARQPTEVERAELERMVQQAVGRVAIRAQMVLLSVRGFSVPEIAHIQDVSDVTVYQWLDRFDAEGPDGLYDRPRSGRPREVDEAVEESIEETMAEPPTEQGYNFTFWTVPLLTEHLRQTLGKTFCPETVRSTLHALGFRWCRPRWAARGGDPQEAERMWAIWEAVQEASEEALILLQDETIFKQLPPLRAMWTKKGQQVRVPTPPGNDSICLYGVLELNSGDSFYAFFEKGRSDFTIAYLEQLLEHYPQRPILLIWDQASFHTSRMVEDWLDAHPRITVMLLPSRAPQLNPIEQVWKHLKDRTAANLTRSLEGIQDAVEKFFEQHHPIDLLRMAGLATNS